MESSVVASGATPSNEQRLVAAASAGDERAFEQLIATHREMMRTVCHRICGDAFAADDAFQLALIASWRGLPRFDGRSRLSTWLYRVAYNASLGVLRSNRRHRSEPITEASGTPSTTGDPAAAVAAADAVHRALARIPVDFRAAVVLRDLCGCSYQEVADIEQVRIETAKTRIARGRQALAVLGADNTRR